MPAPNPGMVPGNGTGTGPDRGTRARTNTPAPTGVWPRRGQPADPPSPANGHSHGHPPVHSHGHSHSHGPAAPVSRHLRKVIAAVLIPFTAAVLVGLAVLWPDGAPAHERTGVGFDRQTHQATVTKVVPMDCASANPSMRRPDR